MAIIKNIYLSTIYDSKKNRAIKITIQTNKGKFWSSIPSGSSIGRFEEKCFSIQKIKKIFPNIKKQLLKNPINEIDKKLNPEKIGANLSTAISQVAFKYKLGTVHGEVPIHKFPLPLVNVIGGGKHEGSTDIQEFLICPKKSENFKQALQVCKKIYKQIRKHSKKKNYEGAWITKFNDFETLDLLSKFSDKVKIGIDVAASSLYKNGKYHYKKLGLILSPKQQFEFMKKIIEKYNLFYVEDPFHESDYKNFKLLKDQTNCLICGDDLFATHPARIKKYHDSSNAIIIKPNQIGTVSKAIEAINLAKKYKMKVIISHRSGETLDTFISDFALFTKAPYVKCSLGVKEHEIKYKRLEKLLN